MLTPFTADNQVDYAGLKALTQWYIDRGCSGLFAVCQSSEMFYLSLEERIAIAKTVLQQAHGQVPVIVSGHVADTISDQIDELKAIAALKPAALILITNRLARADENHQVWRNHLELIMQALPEDLPLGLYECPYPYKRLIDNDNLKFIADSGRFHFLKDTCCDLELLQQRAKITQGSKLKIYNANTTTLLDSLKAGCHGFCGVMASFQMDLYAKLCANIHAPWAEDLQHMLTVTSLIERQYYPVNAKYYLQQFEHLPITTISRTREASGLSETFKDEVRQLKDLSDSYARFLNL